MSDEQAKLDLEDGAEEQTELFEEQSDDLIDEDDALDDEIATENLSPAEERELAEAMQLADGSDEAGFLPESKEDEAEESPEQDFSGTELESFESPEIEDVEFIQTEQLESIIESILFASDRPVSMASISQVFKGTNVRKRQIHQALENLAITYADPKRGVTLEEVTGGYQLRTKIDNMEFLKKTVKGRPFKLSGPALEVLSIVAYKQPLVKIAIDEIRGVESGHLLRALMEKGLVSFAGKSELPGKPMLYQTTRKFLEIFGLRNLKELPSLSEIDSLLPEGITEDEDNIKLSDLTESLSEETGSNSYSIGEEELTKISDQLSAIETSTDFFEEEKKRQRELRDKERAQDIREAMEMGEEVADKDKRWLERYELSLIEAQQLEAAAVETNEQAPTEDSPVAETTPSEETLVESGEETVLEASDQGEVQPEDAISLVADETPLDDNTQPAEDTQLVDQDSQPADELQAQSAEDTPSSEEPASEPPKQNVVNEKLARALAAFREGWPTDDEASTPKKKKPPESEL